ncbi:MAG: hypothetical protein DMF69_11460 [Acidobacteria bacterium]|nr:MAG: hypothetical protein DMF69_11460 [Acidobacteriota bacterium]
MASDSGIPNRKLVSYYRAKLSELGYDYKIFAASLTGQESLNPHLQLPLTPDRKPERLMDLIAKIRPNLSSGFRNASDEDLLVDGIFIVGKKPGN